MRVETALHPVRLRNIWPWLLYFLATSSLVLLTLPMAFVSEWRRRRFSPILLLAAVGLLANLLLLLNYSTTIGWRYLSTGLPAMVPLCSHYLFRSLSKRLGTQRRAFIVAAAAIALIGFSFGVYLWPVRSATVAVREAAKEYDRELMKVPSDALMISGGQSGGGSFLGGGWGGGLGGLRSRAGGALGRME